MKPFGNRRRQAPYEPQQSLPEPVELPADGPVELPGSEGSYIVSERGNHVLPEVYEPRPVDGSGSDTTLKIEKQFFGVRRRVFFVLVSLGVLVIAGCVCGGIFANVSSKSEPDVPGAAAGTSRTTG